MESESQASVADLVSAGAESGDIGKKKRIWLNDDSCVRHRPLHQNDVWSYGFVAARTSNGRPLRLLPVIDECTRMCLSIDVARKRSSEDVLCRHAELFISRGVPKYLRSDNGPEFTSKKVIGWLNHVEVNTHIIEPGSP